MATKKSCALKPWRSVPGMPGVQAPLSFTGDYTISHRQNDHTVSYRPPGQHHHVGSYKTRALARKRAAQHWRELCETGKLPAKELWKPYAPKGR